MRASDLNVGDDVLVTRKHERWLGSVVEVIGKSVRVSNDAPGRGQRFEGWFLEDSVRPATYVKVELGLWVDPLQWGAGGDHRDHEVRDAVRRYVYKTVCEAPRIRQRGVIVRLCSRLKWRGKGTYTSLENRPPAKRVTSDVHDGATNSRWNSVRVSPGDSPDEAVNESPETGVTISRRPATQTTPRTMADYGDVKWGSVSIARFRKEMAEHLNNVVYRRTHYMLTRRSVPVAFLVPTMTPKGR